MADVPSRRDFLKLGGLGTAALAFKPRLPENKEGQERIIRLPAIIGICKTKDLPKEEGEYPPAEGESFTLSRLIGTEGQVQEMNKTKSDKNGVVIFDNLPPGDYYLVANFPGDTIQTKPCKVTPTTTVAFAGIFTKDVPDKNRPTQLRNLTIT